jgi:hypothetical protein
MAWSSELPLYPRARALPSRHLVNEARIVDSEETKTTPYVICDGIVVIPRHSTLESGSVI